MREMCIWVKEEEIRKFLHYFGEGPFSKDDEIFSAVCFKRFLEKKNEKPYTIGFKVSGNKVTELPDWSNATLGDLKRVMRNMIAQDDPVDFLLCEGDVSDKKEHAFGIQVKRFNASADESTQQMIKYLHVDLTKKYGVKKLKTALLLVLGTADFNLMKVHEAIKTCPFPFRTN